MIPATRRLATIALVVLVALPSWGADLTDAQMRAAERLLADRARRPIPVEQVTTALLTKLHSLPNALLAMRKVLRQKGFAALSDRIGALRYEANLDLWRQIVRETGVDIELNRAGKADGALSDLDSFFFTSATAIPGHADIAPHQVHQWLHDRHAELWRERFGGLEPETFDVMHFPGDTFMRDWRMNLGTWAEHLADLDVSLSVLSGTTGAYFLPGAYKEQVYLQYLAKGETVRLTPSATEPEGVKTQTGRTRDISIVYRHVPFEVDPHGQLENALQNVREADHVTDPIKRAKYENRIPEGQAKAFTNLEVSLQTLDLLGRDAAFEGAIRKMYSRFADPKAMPGVLGDMNEVIRVVRLLHRIEFDKIIGALGSRPRPPVWSPKWQRYQPIETLDTNARLEYFEKEVDQIRRARRLTDADVAANRDSLASEAEALFQRKATAVARMNVTVAAERMFRDVFTAQGFARQRHLYGRDAALRLLAERVRGLHASLAAIDDPEMLRAVVDAAPPEVRDAVSLVGEIAGIQRAVVARRGRIEARELAESNEALQRIMRRLGLTPMTRFNPELVSFDETSRNARWTAYDEILRRERARQPQPEPSNRLPFLPDSFRDIGEGLAGELVSLGAVESALQMYEAHLRGDADAAVRIFRDAVIEAVPFWGSAYSAARSAHESGDAGSLWPIVKFAANVGAAAALGDIYGGAMAIYGIATTAFAIEWQFYGQPTETTALSWILMGDLSATGASLGDRAVAGDRTGSRLPPIRDRRNLKETALLLTHVALPPLTPDERRLLVRAHFLAYANREAGRNDRRPGSPAWRDARDRAMADLERDADYWLRRAFFYQAVHTGFFRWVQSITSDANWQRIDRDPPSSIAQMSQGDRVRAYPDAYIQRTGGVAMWDHDRVWLRRYFETWLADYTRAWREANLEHGEFMAALAAQAPGWERAVVDALIAYYLEGEVLDLSKEALIAQRLPADVARQQQAREAARAGLASARRKLAQELEPARKAMLDLANRLDNTLWSPQLTEHLRAALERSLAAQPAYQPAAPTLSLRIPDPVSALREPLPIHTRVNGDPTLVPDDLTTSVTLRPTARWIGKRPPGVLRWDVDTHLGPSVPDAKVVVVGAEAEVTVTSPSVPTLRLQASAPVFFLERLDRQPGTERPTGKVEISLVP